MEVTATIWRLALAALVRAGFPLLAKAAQTLDPSARRCCQGQVQVSENHRDFRTYLPC
jgi:hypothetical protein